MKQEQKILMGASPKARLVLDFLSSERRLDEIDFIVDRDQSKIGSMWFGKKVVSDLDGLLASPSSREFSLCVCLSEKKFEDRTNIQTRLHNLKINMFSIISKNTTVADSAEIKAGSIIFPNTYIGSFSKIGELVTVYVGALVEHDCVIEDNVEISPRVALAGGVTIKKNTFVGINATVLPNITIGSGVIVGAGAVVTKDVQDNLVVVGNPAKAIRDNLR
jgi:sugar O-acyltransferase (sialic acid O-acetyltransferase NeuD family)